MGEYIVTWIRYINIPLSICLYYMYRKKYVTKKVALFDPSLENDTYWHKWKADRVFENVKCLPLSVD